MPIQPFLHGAPAHTGPDPSEETSARTEQPRRQRDAGRCCTPLDGANPAASLQTTKIGNLLLDISSPKCRPFARNSPFEWNSSPTVSQDLTYPRVTTASTSPYRISPPVQAPKWAKIHRRSNTHVLPQLDATTAQLVIAQTRTWSRRRIQSTSRKNWKTTIGYNLPLVPAKEMKTPHISSR